MVRPPRCRGQTSCHTRRVDRRTIQLLTATARRIDREGLTPEALDDLERAGVELRLDWHPTVADAWR